MRIVNNPTMAGFRYIWHGLGEELKRAPLVERLKWQQMVVEGSDLHKTHELSNVILSWDEIPEDRETLADMIDPDLPWAEDHFQERVSGEPMNPGKAHAYWPYHGQEIRRHLREMEGQGQFYDHNYMERMWCRSLEMGTIDIESAVLMEGPDGVAVEVNQSMHPPFSGYRFNVGDLGSVIDLLRNEPTTRQAYLPLWFPEDTGVTSGQRVPCTLGYYFIQGPKGLEMTYFMRACEWYRHFKNDIYLAGRLHQWVAEQVGMETSSLTVHIANLHLFKGDTWHVDEV